MEARRGVLFAIAAAAAFVAISLQGCDPAPGPSPAPSPTPGWNLPPISVKGQHLYFPNNTQFHIRGVGFPDIGGDDNVQDWIDVLKRISGSSPKVNAVRIYRPPACALNVSSTCFEPFMREADKLGIYVVVPGSGVQWGTFPGTPDGCDPPMSQGLQGCYEKGGVLGFGRMVINNFNFPNTLAIILANEVEQNMGAMPVLKAYARDMKLWMQECNTNDESPSKGVMRQIPLMYAATDSDAFDDQAGYLFCDSPDVSLDIYGLNVERWCGKTDQDKNGKVQYDKINAKVKAGNWNGAFVHSEEGGPYGGAQGPRTWGQLPDFSASWPYIDGYFAYAYFGKDGFNMFGGSTATANLLDDGKTFFEQINKAAAPPPSIPPQEIANAKCASSIRTKSGGHVKMSSVSDIKIYPTGPSGYAKNCPKPPTANTQATVSVVV